MCYTVFVKCFVNMKFYINEHIIKPSLMENFKQNIFLREWFLVIFGLN